MQSDEKKLHAEYYARTDESGFSRYQWYLERYFKNKVGEKILEIGCGDGGVVQYLKEDNNVYAIDISSSAIKFSKLKGIESFLLDISKEQLPFEDQSIDAVIALEVIEHLKSPQFTIEEIQRVLKKNGRFIVSIPNPRTGHAFLYPCLFKFNNFKKYLLNCGFSILSTDTYGFCPPFWNQIRPRLIRKCELQEKSDNREEASNVFSRISKFLNSSFIVSIRPKIFSWSFIFECQNTENYGAKSVYKEIVDTTKQKS